MIVITSIGGVKQSTPHEAIESFLKAFERGDGKRVISLIDPELTREMTEYYSEDILITMINQMLKQTSLVNYRVNHVQQLSYNEAVAEVYVQFREFGDNYLEEDTSDIYLIMRDGKWYIDDFF